MISYRSRVRRSGVYPPQQSASWHNRNRLLDFRHVVCIVAVRSVQLLLETVRYIVTAVTLQRCNQNAPCSESRLTSHKKRLFNTVSKQSGPLIHSFCHSLLFFCGSLSEPSWMLHTHILHLRGYATDNQADYSWKTQHHPSASLLVYLNKTTEWAVDTDRKSKGKCK